MEINLKFKTTIFGVRSISIIIYIYDIISQCDDHYVIALVILFLFSFINFHIVSMLL